MISLSALFMPQKLAAVSAANEEERKRLEANYKDRISQYDDRLKEVRAVLLHEVTRCGLWFSAMVRKLPPRVNTFAILYHALNAT